MANLPLAHVEAGLRSHDLALPWPEEGNRVAIDQMSDLLFAATEANAANLRAEQVTGRIMVTGNTAIDALFRLLGTLPPKPASTSGLPRLLVTCHRRENWAGAFTAIGLRCWNWRSRPGWPSTSSFNPTPPWPRRRGACSAVTRGFDCWRQWTTATWSPPFVPPAWS